MIDSISDLFTRIRNANLARRAKVFVPYTKINESLINILFKHGFIGDFEKVTSQLLITLKYKNTNKKPIILQIKRLSRPGCRLYVNAKNIPQICGKLGVVFLSTSKGILSDREAAFYKIGGEILGFVS
uniref:Small ribosomal subunit protein uS8c n=1 Tax=Pseudochlorodesmis sp. HV01306c TaxID=2358490 RepID=A0A386AYH9_9CHLO|nr:ribosomal protein S8 [Pseudochlorodesmis sp. HV01306c]